MISSALENPLKCTTYPMSEAIDLREASNNSLSSGCGEGLGARALFLAQLIISIVVLPLTLLAIVFCPALALCIDGGAEAWKVLKQTSLYTLMHLTLIPTTLVASLAPHSWECMSPTKEMLDCLGIK